MPVPTTFTANRNALDAPRYLNWSLGLEKKLPAAIFLKLEFLRETRRAWLRLQHAEWRSRTATFFSRTGATTAMMPFTISVRHRFRQYYEIFGAYTRSRSRTNQVFDFSLDIPLLSPQLPGPYPWDTPNRFVGWGMLPFFKLPILHKVDLVYSAEARTGLPFLATTDQGEIAPGRSSGNLSPSHLLHGESAIRKTLPSVRTLLGSARRLRQRDQSCQRPIGKRRARLRASRSQLSSTAMAAPSLAASDISGRQ